MALNSYGGTWTGLSGKNPTDNASSGTGAKNQQRGGADPLESNDPPEKLIIEIGEITKLTLPELQKPSSRDVAVVALFEDQNINDVMDHVRNRTKPVEAKFLFSAYTANLKPQQIIIPVPNPKRALRLYLVCITTKVTTDGPKVQKEVQMEGQGYTVGIPVDKCRTYRWERRGISAAGVPNESGPFIEAYIRCCAASAGAAIPDDKTTPILDAYNN